MDILLQEHSKRRPRFSATMASHATGIAAFYYGAGAVRASKLACKALYRLKVEQLREQPCHGIR